MAEPKQSVSIRVHLWLKLALWYLPLAWLWFRLIDHLRLEWAVNPQYAYGWAVPFLCLYLLWRKAESRKQKVEIGVGKTESLVRSEKTCVSEGGSPSSLEARLPEFGTKVMNGKV